MNSNFKAALLLERAFNACISSKWVTDLRVSDTVHNAKMVDSEGYSGEKSTSKSSAKLI